MKPINVQIIKDVEIFTVTIVGDAILVSFYGGPENACGSTLIRPENFLYDTAKFLEKLRTLGIRVNIINTNGKTTIIPSTKPHD